MTLVAGHDYYTCAYCTTFVFPEQTEDHVRVLTEPVGSSCPLCKHALVAGPAPLIEALDLGDFPVEWTPEAPLEDVAAARLAGAARIHSRREGNLLIEGKVRCGDAEGALKDAPVTAAAAEPTTGRGGLSAMPKRRWPPPSLASATQ